MDAAKGERMKTVKMTRAELRNAIADLRGWKCGNCDEGAPHIGCPIDKFGMDVYAMPDYLRDMNEAMVLFREIPDVGLEYPEGGPLVFWWDEMTMKSVFGDGMRNEAEVICAAWYEFKTGVRVEVSE